MGDFWDDASTMFLQETYLDDAPDPRQKTAFEGEQFTAMRALTDSARRKNALSLPVEAGARVRFVANLGSVLTYSDVPNTGVEGTVVTVRTAAGDATSLEERVFVQWDDGKFRPIMAEHLRRAKTNRKQARNVRMVVSDLGDISALFVPALGMGRTGGDDLVHKATKDLWSFRQEGEQYVIERLFQEDGKPLKV